MRKLYKAGAILLFVMAAAYIAAAYKEVRPYRESKETHTKLQNLVVDMQEPQSPAKRSIDFTVLQGINPDIAAWIYIPGTACAQKSPAQYKLATWYLQDTAFSKR